MHLHAKQTKWQCSNTMVSALSRTPKEDNDWQTNSGDTYNYFSYGAAVSEVEIDTLSGDHVVSNHGNCFVLVNDLHGDRYWLSMDQLVTVYANSKVMFRGRCHVSYHAVSNVSSNVN